MCHPEMPGGRTSLLAPTESVAIPLPSGERLPAELVSPDPDPAAAAPAPATVVVVADIFGPSEFYRDLCARLAGSGLQALMPDYFFRQGPLDERTIEAALARRAELDEVGALDDLRATIAWVRERAGDPDAPVGVLGFCMGGTLALDLAALEQRLVTVAYYGFPIPQPTVVSPPPAPLSLASDMSGPILAFWGDQDTAVGTQNIERFVDAIKGSSAEFEHHVYAGLGHGFLAQAQMEDEPEEGDDASRSWRLAVEHFRRHLHR